MSLIQFSSLYSEGKGLTKRCMKKNLRKKKPFCVALPFIVIGSYPLALKNDFCPTVNSVRFKDDMSRFTCFLKTLVLKLFKII